MCLFDCVPFVLFRYQNICFTPNNSDLTELSTYSADETVQIGTFIENGVSKPLYRSIFVYRNVTEGAVYNVNINYHNIFSVNGRAIFGAYVLPLGYSDNSNSVFNVFLSKVNDTTTRINIFQAHVGSSTTTPAEEVVIVIEHI